MKGFELKIYDMNNNQLYKELFTSHQTKKDDVEKKAKQILDDSGSISQRKNLKPASFKIFER